MKALPKTEKPLKFSAGLILLSAIFMILVLPSVYSETIPGEKNMPPTIAISIAALVRFVLFISCVWILKQIRIDGGKRKNRDYLLLVALLLLFFGLFYINGAFAYLNDEPIYMSIFMFISVFCDLFAAILLLIGRRVLKK